MIENLGCSIKKYFKDIKVFKYFQTLCKNENKLNRVPVLQINLQLQL